MQVRLPAGNGLVSVRRVAVLVVVAALLASPGLLWSKGSDNDRQRIEFAGVIEKRPQGSLAGEWIIGGKTIQTDRYTEFDRSEGDLIPGKCAKVKIRNGRIHEIDSEPQSNCR